jgi:cytochrome-b5 reductase
VNEDKIRRLAFPPSEDTVVVVCGLPGVYEQLCGPRTTAEISARSALANLGYTENMVIKL